MNIAFAQDGDIGAIQDFLDQHWKRDYILAKNRDLFDWQFRSRHADRVNFVIATNKAGEVVGTLGFIPSDHHDDLAAGRLPFLWLTNWMVLRGSVPPGLGVMLRRHLERNLPHSGIGTIGLNRATLDLYRPFGFTTGQMDHHVLVNGALQSFRLLPGTPPDRTGLPPSTTAVLDDITERWTGELPDAADRYLGKGPGYYRRRYLQHPVYRYRCLQLTANHDTLLLFVRRVEVEGAACLRIVEARGDFSLLQNGAAALQDLMQQENLEYIDLISQNVMGEPAHSHWADAEALGVANYFEPYQRGFVPLLYAWKMRQPGITPSLFKGDCDQDAPRIIR